MKAPRFTRLLAALPLLNQPQRRQLLEALHPTAGLDRVVALIDGIRSPGRRCPHCSSEHWHRHGHANDLQRFRCRQCGRTFNDLTGTPLARLRLKGKWPDYLGALLDSRTVRGAAKHVGVHRNTAFRWRHRFLDRAKDDRPAQLTGIVEADETFLLESQKGARKLDRKPRKRGGRAPLRGILHHLDCILVARDRSGQTIDAVTGRGALKVCQLVPTAWRHVACPITSDGTGRSMAGGSLPSSNCYVSPSESSRLNENSALFLCKKRMNFCETVVSMQQGYVKFVLTWP